MIQQWVNIEDEGAPWALLKRLAAHIPVGEMDALWLFPVRRAAGIESTVIVVSSFEPHSLERRRVTATRFLVTRDRKARATVEEQHFDYASAPADALTRVVDGVVRRLGEGESAPREFAVEGSADRWSDLLRELGEPEPIREHAAPGQESEQSSEHGAAEGAGSREEKQEI